VEAYVLTVRGAVQAAGEDWQIKKQEWSNGSSQSKDIVTLIGYYWHLTLAAHTIRSGTTDVVQEQVVDVVYQNKLKFAALLDINPSQVPWVWTSEMDRNRTSLDTYVPDHLVMIDHKQKCVVLTILNTRLSLSQPLDIIMDLNANTEPFLDGEAHGGFVRGTKNLVTKAIPQVLAALNKYPGYSLLILGYSLGRVKIKVYLIWAQYILIYQFVFNNYVF